MFVAAKKHLALFYDKGRRRTQKQGKVVQIHQIDYGAEECDFPITMALHIFVFLVEKLESEKGTS